MGGKGRERWRDRERNVKVVGEERRAREVFMGWVEEKQ